MNRDVTTLFDVRSAPVRELLARMDVGPGAFAERAVLLTGGARGIGREVALALASLGASLVLVDKLEAGESVAAQIREQGGRCLFIQGNVVRPEVLELALARCEEEFGPVDVLINNAVEFRVRGVLELSPEDWDYTQAANVRAPLQAIRAVLPGMMARGGGIICNMVGPGGIAWAADMSASKAALRSLTVSVAAEAPSVAVFGFLPPLVATELVRENFPLYAERLGMDFDQYVCETRPNPGYPGLMPVEHCAASVVHRLVHARRHDGTVVGAFEPLYAAGIVEEPSLTEEDLSFAVDNAARLRDEVASVRSRNRQLDREVRRRTHELSRVASNVGSSVDAIVTIDLKGRFTSVNAAAVALFGWTEEELLGSSIGRLAPESARDEQRALSQGVLRGESPEPRDTTRVCKDGTVVDVSVVLFPLHEAGRLVGGAAIIRDIRPAVAARQRLAETEEQLRQSAKMVAMGELAGGVAHDFNNMLTVFLHCTESVLQTLGPSHPCAEELRDALDAASRTQVLTKQLLTFSRREPSNPTMLDLRAVVQEMRRLLDRTLGASIDTRVEGEDGLAVLIDRNSMEQVLLNLAVNARDAMRRGGTLRFEMHAVEGDRPPELPEGEVVVLHVTDDGVGMSADVAARAMEPFFTTKPVGTGTGMGLALVYGVISGAGGAVRIRSEPGGGTRVSLYLPRGGKMEQSVSFDAPVEDKRLILLVEDEDLVRRVARRILRREGYSVLEARDGMEGLEMLEQHHAEVALVFTDVVMPRLSGPDMAIQIRERWPTMPIVYTSGYAGDHRMLSEIEADGPVLPKPYREDELLAVLSVVLDP